MNSSDNSFTIRDNSSEFAKYLPKEWIEPLTIISRVKNYSGIDEYILKLIEDKIDQFTDTRDNLDDFQTYMHNMIKGKDVPNEWASNQNEEDKSSEFVKDVNEEYHNMKNTDDKEN